MIRTRAGVLVEGGKTPELRFMRRREVEAAIGVSRSTLYSMIAKGQFPPPVHITAGAVGWPEHEVARWLQARIASRDRGREVADD